MKIDISTMLEGSDWIENKVFFPAKQMVCHLKIWVKRYEVFQHKWPSYKSLCEAAHFCSPTTQVNISSVPWYKVYSFL
jgi:hypothetical protein